MSALFTPLKVGRCNLAHRIVMSPLTRFRADDDAVHHEIAAEYYGQRASNGGLQITEATFISEEAGGYRNVPGIWNDAQVAGWSNVTQSVHNKGGHIFLQMWALGRAAEADFLASKGHSVVSASNIPKPGGAVPIPLTTNDIQRYVQMYVHAAKNAVLRAGFDGVEIHNANGYLLDQFLQSVSNERTDEYGGSIENRSRFSLMVVKAVTEAVGEDRVGIRFSPFSTFQGMKMPDPIPTFSYIIREIRDRHPELAYVHLTEPQAAGSGEQDPAAYSLDFARRIWNENRPRAFLSAGGYDPEIAEKVVKEYGGAAVFGRWFISNPDLPLRIRKGIPLNQYNPKTFYSKGIHAVGGYTDYPFAPVDTDETPSSHM